MKRALLWTVGIVGLLVVLVAVAINHAVSNFELFAPDPPSDYSPTWTPDGKHIVFKETTDHRDHYETDLYEIDADGQNKHRLNAADAGAYSPDGSRIAFVKGADLFVARVDGSNPQRLGPHTRLLEEAPAWSPDGKQLAVSRRAESWDWDPVPEWLVVVRADGSGHPRRLVRTEAELNSQAVYDEQHPSWSPDGRLIAYHGPDGIYVIPSAGGKPRLIAGGDLNLPTWAPHTNRLAAVDLNTIKIFQLRGRRRARITRTFKLSGLWFQGGVGDIAWEPNERAIAFSGANDYSDASCIFVLDPKSGSVTALTNPEHKCNVHAKRQRVGVPQG